MSQNVRARDVAIVAGDFVRTGGMDRANFALADYLERSGYAVELVAHRIESELASSPRIRFRRVPKPLGSYSLGEPLLDLVGRRAARMARARGGVTIVNGGNCLAAPVNWVHYVHAAYRPTSERVGRSVARSLLDYRSRSRERKALRLARLVIANSAATRRTLIEELGVPAERAVVVYYGMDATEFVPTDPGGAAEHRRRLGWPERLTVAFVGALGDRRKGFDTIFAAFRELCRDPTWDVDVVAVGGGAEVEHWQARARDAGIEERVRLLGFRTDVQRVLAACDAMVAPARYEAFGLAAAEAIAMGLPTLVSRSAGIAELYPDDLDHLLLDDPDSASELVRRLRSWRQAPDEQRERMRSLSAKIRARTWDHMAAEIADLVERRVL
ncbi:MAG TPA: glycosyltransferase family 4 protein [Polyangiaceae bacterium]